MPQPQHKRNSPNWLEEIDDASWGTAWEEISSTWGKLKVLEHKLQQNIQWCFRVSGQSKSAAEEAMALAMAVKGRGMVLANETVCMGGTSGQSWNPETAK